MEPVVIGVAGGTGSGKTTVAREVLKRAGTKQISFIQHDAYYKDLNDLPEAQRAMQNFDHPDALDNERATPARLNSGRDSMAFR